MYEHTQLFSNELNRIMSLREDLLELIGPGNKELMETNHDNHFKYLASLSSLYDPTSLVETVIWVIRTYVNHGFSQKYWAVMVPEAKHVVKDNLSSEEYEEVSAIYDFISNNFELFVEVAEHSPSFYEEIGTLKGLLGKRGNHDDE